MAKVVDLGDLPMKPSKVSMFRDSGSSDTEYSYIGDDIVKGMLETLDVPKVQGHKRIELRASGLPYCEIRKFLFNPSPENYAKDFYTSTGTAIHEALQQWAPRGDYKSYIFGNWRCTGCGAVKKMCITPRRKCVECVDLPLQPKHLGKTHYWKYEEIDFKYKSLSGHIDMVLRISRNPDRYIVIDFKTTDMDKKRESRYWDPMQPSSKSYILQIRTYCTILEKLFGLNIVGWHVISINRSAPIKTAKDYHLLSGEWNEGDSDKFIKYLERDIRGYKNLQHLLKRINKGDKTEASAALETMANDRPCSDLKSYKRWMDKAFFGKEKCEMLDACCMSTRRVVARIKQELENSDDG